MEEKEGWSRKEEIGRGSNRYEREFSLFKGCYEGSSDFYHHFIFGGIIL